MIDMKGLIRLCGVPSWNYCCSFKILNLYIEKLSFQFTASSVLDASGMHDAKSKVDFVTENLKISLMLSYFLAHFVRFLICEIPDSMPLSTATTSG